MNEFRERFLEILKEKILYVAYVASDFPGAPANYPLIFPFSYSPRIPPIPSRKQPSSPAMAASSVRTLYLARGRVIVKDTNE